jgi:hypothetical protein
MTICITRHSILVAACWITGLAFAVVDVILAPDWAALSTVFLILGATLTVKRSVDKYAATWTRAYEMGREVEDQDVRKIR